MLPTRSLACTLLAVAAALTAPLAAPRAEAAAAAGRAPTCTARGGGPGAGGGRSRRAACTPRGRRGARRYRQWAELHGDELEFEEVELLGEMHAGGSGEGWAFRASSTTTISPKRRRVVDDTPWITTLDCRFSLD